MPCQPSTALVDFEAKVCPRAELLARTATLSRPLVLTNGVFDLLHRGHVTYLAQARALGAALIVAVNGDASAQRLGKGPARPVNACADRMAVLAALQSTALVTSFDDDTALEVVRQIRPDIYVKGGDYDVASTIEGRVVLGWGGQAIAIPFLHHVSSTMLLEKMRHR